jgi:hypothetical protein
MMNAPSIGQRSIRAETMSPATISSPHVRFVVCAPLLAEPQGRLLRAMRKP